MGLNEFQQYIQSQYPECLKLIELPEKSIENGNGKIRLILDIQSCLHRVYGGYCNDWVCGGQWNKLLEFLNGLFNILRRKNIDLTVVFNGCAENSRMHQWKDYQNIQRLKVDQILHHVEVKGTPPPKIWWLAPACLQTVLRLILQAGVNVYCTINDHHKELMQFYFQNKCDGLIADDLEYLALGVKSYYIGDSLKIFKAGINVIKLDKEKMMESLQAHHTHLLVMTALLNNSILLDHIIPFSFNMPFTIQNNSTNFMKELIKFVITLPSDSQLSSLGSQIFGSSDHNIIQLFIDWLNYYENYRIISDKSLGESEIPVKQSIHPCLSKDRCISQAEQNISFKILNTVKERHKLGGMSPWVYHVLTKHEIRFPVGIEEEIASEIPLSAYFYRPIRQIVYSILLEELKKKNNQISVKEWIWKRSNKFSSPDIVTVLPLDKAVLPLEKLWFGKTADDTTGRMKTFLFCMKNDSKLILNLSYVPKHLILLCCVLRYMITYPNGAILRKQELDCFLAQAVSRNLLNSNVNHNIEITKLTVRGILLASLFMNGVEHAIFANEICGFPIPPAMCYPFLFFDGKLFQKKLSKINETRTVIELCDGNLNEVATLEKLRMAILDGLKVQFAFMPFSKPKQNVEMKNHLYKNYVECYLEKEETAPSKGYFYRPGGNLKVAGMVVGKWDSNFGQKSYCRGQPILSDRKIPLQNVGRYFKNEKQLETMNHTTDYRNVEQFFKIPRGKVKNSQKNVNVGMRKMNLGLGRGCTVDTKSKVIEVSQLTNEMNATSEFSDADSESEDVVEESIKETEKITVKNEVPIIQKEKEEESDDADILPQFSINSYRPIKCKENKN